MSLRYYGAHCSGVYVSQFHVLFLWMMYTYRKCERVMVEVTTDTVRNLVFGDVSLCSLVGVPAILRNMLLAFSGYKGRQ
jgi:hypothetical protein